jgi:hypothetical protein
MEGKRPISRFSFYVLLLLLALLLCQSLVKLRLHLVPELENLVVTVCEARGKGQREKERVESRGRR